MTSLLVLGGTAWVGGEVARHALERGWEVTCLARGASGGVPDGAEFVVADRSRFGAYDEVAARTFDFAVEVSWEPRFVAEAVAALASVVNHWTYVSTVSVYGPGDSPIDESGARVEGLAWDDMAQHRYSEAKVACEDATLDARSGAVFLPRPGIIGGPGDPFDRLTYWPVRAALAGDGPLLVPAQDCPVQVIDVRDLVAWMLDCMEAGVTGPANAVGRTLPHSEMVALARRAAGHTGPVVEAPADFLSEREINRRGRRHSLPLWQDQQPHREFSWSRYEATGGAWRPLADTIADELREARELGLDRELVSGLARDEELGLIAELG